MLSYHFTVYKVMQIILCLYHIISEYSLTNVLLLLQKFEGITVDPKLKTETAYIVCQSIDMDAYICLFQAFLLPAKRGRNACCPFTVTHKLAIHLLHSGSL